MLRVTVLNDERGAIFKMEGKLTSEWVAEAEKAWMAFSNLPQPQGRVVDLCGVSFVDDPGRELLARMYSSGAKLIGTGPMTSALIAEICEDDQPNGSSWIRSVLSVFLLLALLGLAPRVNIPSNHERRRSQEYAAFATPDGEPTAHQHVRFVSVPGDQRPWHQSPERSFLMSHEEKTA